MDAHAAVRGRLIWPAHLPALAAYAAITVALTWPLVLSPGTLVPGDLGDPLLTTTILWWNAQHVPFTDSWWHGNFFFPGGHALAFSDHRVGISLFTTPVIWIGVSPIAANAVMFLLTWWLSATAAYALVWTLTSSHAAAFIGGLVFGFNPFRAGHLPHLELLASYWLPVVLLALHQWLRTRRTWWLVLFAVAQLLQGLTSGYYFFFMGVLILLWLAWFARGLTAREYARLGAALVAPAICLAPVLAHYSEVHDRLGLARSIDEIEALSADFVSFVAAPEPLALWNSPASWRRPEGDLMPGLTAVLLVAAAVTAAARRPRIEVPRPRVVTLIRRGLLVLALVAVGVAVAPMFAGPIAFDVSGVSMSSRGQHKPLSFALLLAVLWLGTSRLFISVFKSQSLLGFYCVAALAMWLLALGPEGRFMGHPVLYKPPYAWLMELPGFGDAFRAPARFAMVAVLALSVATGLAVARFLPRLAKKGRLVAAAALAIAVVAESWIHPFPVAAAPPPLALPAQVPAEAAVLELPLGVFENALAMFHATDHRRPTVNGMAGYSPPHYQVLSRAIGEGNLDVLIGIRRYADLAIVTARDADGARITSRLRAAPHTAPLPDTSGRHVTMAAMMPEPPGHSWPVLEEVRAAHIVTHPPGSASQLIDGDLSTAWVSGAPQSGTETLTLSLHHRRVIGGVRIDLGRHATAFPRTVAVDVSVDGRQWDTVTTADGAMPAFNAALRDPGRLGVTFTFEPRAASHLRIRQLGRSQDHWVVVELRVLARGNH